MNDDISAGQAGTVGELLEDRPLLEHFKERRRRGIKLCGPIWDRAKKNHAFASPGESQWPESDAKIAEKHKLAALTFNEVHPIIRSLSGRQVMLDRYQRIYIARRREVARWAEDMTEVDRAIVEGCDAAQHESTAFHNGPCVGGIGWMSYEIDFLEEPEIGKITICEEPIWNMLWPVDESRHMNLSDRHWHINGRWLPKVEVRARWPRAFKKLVAKMATVDNWTGQGDDGSVSHRIPWRVGGGDDFTASYDRSTHNFWVERYEYRALETRMKVAVLLDDAMSYEEADAIAARGEATQDELFEVRTLKAEEFEGLTERYYKLHGEELPRHNVVAQPAYSYRYALICGDEVLEEGEIPIGSWTRLAITGYRFEQPDRVEWRSVVDALRDPQQWKNVFTTMLLRFIQANPKGLLLYERGMFRDRNTAMAEWGRFDGTVEVSAGKLSQSPNPPFQIVNGAGSPMNGLLESMVAMSDAAIPRLAGFNPGALGQVGPDLRRISGEVVSQVREAAAASQADLFDAFKLYRKQGGETIIRLVHRFYEPEDLATLIGDVAAYRPKVDPTTGEPILDEQGKPVLELIVPPKDVWLKPNWKISIQDQTPAPDRLRAQFESLSASGGLQLLIDRGIMVADELVEIIPDLPEATRESMRARIREAKEQEAGSEASLQQLGEVVAALVQTAAGLDEQQKQTLLSHIQGAPAEQAAA